VKLVIVLLIPFVALFAQGQQKPKICVWVDDESTMSGDLWVMRMQVTL
jgi:hypothetical protein